MEKDLKFPIPENLDTEKRPYTITVRCTPELMENMKKLIPGARSRAQWINDLLSYGVDELTKRQEKKA